MQISNLFLYFFWFSVCYLIIQRRKKQMSKTFLLAFTRQQHSSIRQLLRQKFLQFYFFLYLCRAINAGCSAVGSALRSGRRGRWFESSHPDTVKGKRKQHRLPFLIVLNLSGDSRYFSGDRHII